MESLTDAEISLFRRQAVKMSDYPSGSVRLLAQTLQDVLDEVERLRAQVAELLPWATLAAANVAMPGDGADSMYVRISSGEFGEVA